MDAFIAGTVSSSITNWPGKTSFLVLFAGCDFKCPYCFSSEYLEQKEDFKTDIQNIKREIAENRDFVDAVVFTGAEPCLQRGALLYLAKCCKELKLKTGIETNGSNPEIIKALIEENLIDFVSLDLKSPFDAEMFEKITNSKTFFKDTAEIIENVRKTLGLLRDNKNKIEVEVKTTIVPGLIYRKEDLLEIAKEANGLGERWRIAGFRADKGNVLGNKLKNINAPTAEFLKELKQACKKEYPELKIAVEL